MQGQHYVRQIVISLPAHQSAFLWGARKTGKSTYLKLDFPKSYYVDLLQSDLFLRYLKEPFRFRGEILALSSEQLSLPIIIDEVQKVPELLDEIHWLIENKGLSFILCGSSARKLKHKGVNLLGGRAWKYHLFPLVYPEISDYNLLRVLNHGTIPSHYKASHLKRMMSAYIEDYIIQEIQAEGFVRNLQHFARFIEAAAFSNANLLNHTNISRECGVDSKTVKEYFYLLEDTLIGAHVYPFTKVKKRAVLTQTPKFYFFDVGLANALQKKHILSLSGVDAGQSLETYLFHEIKAYCTYQEIDQEITFWRTRDGKEVDFIIGRGKYAIEVKISNRIRKEDTIGLFTFLDEYPNAKTWLICQETTERIIENEQRHQIRIIPIERFLSKLWNGDIILE